jgi:hypothetical protein
MKSHELDFLAMLRRGAEDIAIKRPVGEDDGHGGIIYSNPVPVGTRRLRVQRLEPDPRRNITEGGAVIVASMRVYAAKDCDLIENDVFERDGKDWTIGPLVALRDHGDVYGYVALAK